MRCRTNTSTLEFRFGFNRRCRAAGAAVRFDEKACAVTRTAADAVAAIVLLLLHLLFAKLFNTFCSSSVRVRARLITPRQADCTVAAAKSSRVIGVERMNVSHCFRLMNRSRASAEQSVSGSPMQKHNLGRTPNVINSAATITLKLNCAQS